MIAVQVALTVAPAVAAGYLWLLAHRIWNAPSR